MNFWIIGFLWGIGRVSGDSFLVQSIDKKSIEKVRDAISPAQKVYPTVEKGKETTWRLKIRLSHPYIQWMFANGYEGRKGNIERNIPVFTNPNDDADFLRGYFFIHHSLDTYRSGNYTSPRLRFFAATNILERLNTHLEKEIGTTQKKIQGHKNSDICKMIYYQSKKEVPLIIEYLKLDDRR